MTALQGRDTGCLPEIERFGEIYQKVVSNKNWEDLVKSFKNKKHILCVGHGGYLAIADHISIDISRLTKGEKIGYCPSSSIHITSDINDLGYDHWLRNWMEKTVSSMNSSHILAIAITSSGASRDIENFINGTKELGIETAVISACDKEYTAEHVINTNCRHYHTSEIVALTLGYELVQGCGYKCPAINGAIMN